MKKLLTCFLLALTLFIFWNIPVRAAAPKTFYQKLETGRSVRVAVLGDSIANSTGIDPQYCWNTLLKNWLESEYNSQVIMDNYAIGGTTSYTGYYQCHTAMSREIQKKGTYDLIIVCYGQNDAPEHFGLIYESLLRRIKLNNPNACLITILESSQGTYTSKMHEIIYLSYLYGADIADTIKAAALTDMTYEEFHPDGIHPGLTGHQIYFETLKEVILQCIEIGRTPTQLPVPFSENIPQLEQYTFIPLKDCLQPDGSYLLISKRPTLGIVLTMSPQSDYVKLNFSNGDIWEANANTTIPLTWSSAFLANLFLPPNTAVILENPNGTMDQTVQGFIISGP